MDITWKKEKDEEIKEIYSGVTGEVLTGILGQSDIYWTNSFRITQEQFDAIKNEVETQGLGSYFDLGTWLPLIVEF